VRPGGPEITRFQAMAAIVARNAREQLRPPVERLGQRSRHCVGYTAALEQGVARLKSYAVPRRPQLGQAVVDVDMVRIEAEVPLVCELRGIKQAPLRIDLPGAGRSHPKVWVESEY